MFEIFIILLLTAFSCGSIGTLLVLRNQTMLADALSHSVLLGIVVGFFISNDLRSPLLLLGAALFGLVAVFSIQTLSRHDKINHDTATGLVFPLFFAIAVILITKYAKNVHLDLDMVLMGEIIFAPLFRTTVLGISISVSMLQVGLMLLLNLLFLLVFYQPLQLFLFDETNAKIIGVPMRLFYLCIPFLVSLTTVVSFNVVGSITVIAFFVSPSMTCLLWVKQFKHLLLGTFIVAFINCCVGFGLSLYFDVTISGMTTFASLIVLMISSIAKVIKTKRIPFTS